MSRCVGRWPLEEGGRRESWPFDTCSFSFTVSVWEVGRHVDGSPWPDISVKVCLHVVCTLLPPLKFSDGVNNLQNGSVTLSLRYSDDNKNNTFNNSGNKGHGLKTLRVYRPLWNKRREA